MTKKELKERMLELKKKMISNSKDAHYAEALYSDMNVLAREIAHEPTLLHITDKEANKKYECETYECVRTEEGVVLRMNSGLTVFVPVRMGDTGIFSWLEHIATHESGKDEEADKIFDIMSADVIMQVTMFTALFSTEQDFAKFKYEWQKKYVEMLYKKIEAIDEPQEQDTEADAEFERTMIDAEKAEKILSESEQNEG